MSGDSRDYFRKNVVDFIQNELEAAIQKRLQAGVRPIAETILDRCRAEMALLPERAIKHLRPYIEAYADAMVTFEPIVRVDVSEFVNFTKGVQL
jgi:hypothetical protein